MLFTRTNSPSIPSAAQRIFFWVLAVFAGLVYAQAALASNITIANPANGTTSSSPLWIRAHNVGCNGLSPTAFGFSIDSLTWLKIHGCPYDPRAIMIPAQPV